MKTLLVAVNASYSHTCLAVRSIAAYSNSGDVVFGEFTINQPVGEILRGIVQQEPELVLFSTYIWNAEVVSKIIPDIKKLLSRCIIGAGGPEFGFAAEKYLNQLKDLDFIVKGEGEKIINNVQKSDFQVFSACLEKMKGIYFRKADGEIFYTGDEQLICDLSELNFPYPELKNGVISDELQNHKIYYYESSRGCPYSCAYCLSSVDKRVRFMPLERVFADLQIFLDAGVGLVKFVDRTYNLQPERYISIWKYIVEHHNKKTMFHFEIEAEYLSEEALEFLQSVSPGVMQFEMGVQSANKETLRAVNRSDNVEKLAQNIKRIPRSIHQHLDLIAGLPFENLESFGKSFDFVMELKPDAFQLGFLKVLHGTQMEQFAKNNGWKWSQNPVYETFSTPYMSYEDMLFLKDVEVLVDAYWNSGVFANTMKFVGRSMGFWNFYCRMVEFGRKRNIFDAAHRETFWFEFLSEYCEKIENSCVIYNLLKYDFVLRGKQGNWPSWYSHVYDKKRHRELLELNGGVKNPRLDFARSEYEVFDCDVDAEFPEKSLKKYEKLIKY